MVRAISVTPSAEFDRAVELQRAGRAAEAEALCRDILQRETDARALHLLGTIRFAAGAQAEGIDLVRRAVMAQSGYGAAEFNLGAMLAAMGDLAAAAEHYGRAAASDPANVEAWWRLGSVLMELQRWAEAEAAFLQVPERRPDDSTALTDLMAVMFEQGDFDAAVDYGRRAIALTPDRAVAHLRLGRALSERGEFAPAIALYRRAVELAPGEIEYRRTLLAALLYSPDHDERERFSEHAKFDAAVAARITQPIPALCNDRDPHRRLRVGWLSSDFREHSVARNIEPLFACRDTKRFETIIYSEVGAPDATTEWFRSKADLWRSTVNLSDEAVAAMIRSDRIDAMVYVAGRFDRNRPQIAARRAAPVQLSLYDAATSGLREMDYFLADRLLVPRQTAECFAERVIRLPGLYAHLPLVDAPQPGPPRTQRASVTFGSFNHPAKLSAGTLALWTQILSRLPGARICFKYLDRFASPDLQERVRQQLGPEVARRAEFKTGTQSIGEHLQLYQDIDIALDPFPYNGSTTTFDALWMGVPVVTLAGDHVMSRWSAAMLHALKLDELIATTPEDYVAKAIGLASDAERIADLRSTLRRRITNSPFCDGKLRTRQFERVLRATWRRWCALG
jgi:predicted O-linked N-acetylglucosamine transferase (SPINDLY family)